MTEHITQHVQHSCETRAPTSHLAVVVPVGGCKSWLQGTAECGFCAFFACIEDVPPASRHANTAAAVDPEAGARGSPPVSHHPTMMHAEPHAPVCQSGLDGRANTPGTAVVARLHTKTAMLPGQKVTSD